VWGLHVLEVTAAPYWHPIYEVNTVHCKSLSVACACMWIYAFLLLCISGQAETSAMTGSAMFYTYFFKNVIRHNENFGFKMCFTTCGYVTYSTFCMWVAALELEPCSMVAVIAVVCCEQELVSRMKWNMNIGSLQQWLFMAFWEVYRETAVNISFDALIEQT